MSEKPFISIRADIEDVQERLSETSKSLKSIRRQTVGIAARTTVRQIKTVIRATTKRHTGELLKTYGYKVKKDGTTAGIFPKTVSSNNHLILAKIATLSYGNDISASRRKWLQVNGAGYFARPKTVHIDPRGFVQSGETFAGKGAYMAEVEKMIQKELDKLWKK